MKSQLSFHGLSEYVDYLQSSGIYVFSIQEAQQKLNCSLAALRLAIYRLSAKKRIARLRHDFYVIVPVEYRSMGSPPPSWYIDFFMRYYKLTYYVGLLSAAALYGAAHQQPQEFQVVTTQPLRPILLPKTRVQFFVKNEIFKNDVVKRQTETGYMLISSPELTAMDLVRYVKSSGHLNNVVTVLIELAERINVKNLILVAEHLPLVITQRLGLLLEQFTDLNVDELCQWLSAQNIRTTALRPDRGHRNCERNLRWKVWVNERVEPDI